MNPDFAWSTHQPLIRLLLKVYDPKFILELGIGYYSTPLFLSHKCEKIFIENDKEWINKMNLTENVIWHEIAIPNQDIPVRDITTEQRQGIITDYEYLCNTIKQTGCNLLFVDNYSCCRALAINTLYPVFDLIIYHDCEPQSIIRNNYFFKSDLLRSFAHFNLVTPRTWAGCFIRREMIFNEKVLFDEIQPIIEDYQRENNVLGISFKKMNDV